MTYPPSTPPITGRILAEILRRIDELEKRPFEGSGSGEGAIGGGGGAASKLDDYLVYFAYDDTEEHVISLPAGTPFNKVLSSFPLDFGDGVYYESLQPVANIAWCDSVEIVDSDTYSSVSVSSVTGQGYGGNPFGSQYAYLGSDHIGIAGTNAQILSPAKNIPFPQSDFPSYYIFAYGASSLTGFFVCRLSNYYAPMTVKIKGLHRRDVFATSWKRNKSASTGGGITPPPSGNGVLNVTVTDCTSHSAIVGVTVTLTLPTSGQVVGTQITDYSGHCSFSGLGDGMYVLNAAKPGYDQSSADGTIAGGNAVSVPMCLDVTTGLTITVLVQDSSDGTYIANALVTVKNTSTGWSKSLYTPLVSAAAVFGIPTLGTYTISASALGYGSKTVTENVSTSSTYTLQLTRLGWRVMVQVIDALSGKDLAGASVFCSIGASSGTDLSGLAYFVVPTGTYTFTASKSGYQNNSSIPILVNQNMDGFNGHPRGPAIYLVPVNASINVNVTKFNQSAGRFVPAPGVVVELHNAAGGTVGQQTTDSSGNCTFSNLIPGGSYKAIASASGYAQGSASGVAPCSLQLSLQPTIGSGPYYVALSVKDAATGHGIAGVSIAAYTGGHYLGAFPPTDSNGNMPQNATWPWTPGTYTLIASPAGYYQETIVITVPGTSSATFELIHV